MIDSASSKTVLASANPTPCFRFQTSPVEFSESKAAPEGEAARFGVSRPFAPRLQSISPPHVAMASFRSHPGFALTRRPPARRSGRSGRPQRTAAARARIPLRPAAPTRSAAPSGNPRTPPRCRPALPSAAASIRAVGRVTGLQNRSQCSTSASGRLSFRGCSAGCPTGTRLMRR